MEHDYKFVHFDEYCDKCKHRDTASSQEPCDECLSNPTNLQSHKPVKFESSDDAIADYGYFKERRKVKPYLYELTYRNFDYDFANKYFTAKGDIPAGMCSSVRNENWYGRNFDWFYNEEAEFIVRSPRMGNKLKSIGIAGGISNLSDAVANSGRYSELYKIVPFMMHDGINEFGVVANINVVPMDYGANTTIPTRNLKEKVCAVSIVRFIIDRFTSAHEAAFYIRDHVQCYFPKALHDMEYEIHVMIADQKDTYLLEFIDNQTVVTDISSKPYMTNFYLYDVRFNKNGMVFTPETSIGGFNAKTFNRITDHGSGLERYNYICENYEGTNSKEGMRNLLNELMYTKAYSTSSSPANPFWYTEFVGERGLTVANDASDFSDVVDIAGGYFANRNRNDGNKTWQTVHSVIYDIEKREMHVIVQEDGEELTFSL